MRRAQIGVLELQTTTLQAWPRGLRLVCIAGRLVEHVALARDGRAPTRKKWRGVPEGSVRHMLEGGDEQPRLRADAAARRRWGAASRPRRCRCRNRRSLTIARRFDALREYARDAATPALRLLRSPSC